MGSRKLIINIHSDVGEKKLLKNAMNEIEEFTCVRFVKRTVETDYIVFTPEVEGSCHSQVGKMAANMQPQEINLSRRGCLQHGIIMHEIIHAVS